MVYYTLISCINYSLCNYLVFYENVAVAPVITMLLILPLLIVVFSCSEAVVFFRNSAVRSSIPLTTSALALSCLGCCGCGSSLNIASSRFVAGENKLPKPL
jgi:hypothetical protein